MLDPTGTVEVIVYEVIEHPDPEGDPEKTEVEQGETYAESNVVGDDHLYFADLKVAQGERFGICIKLGAGFDWHNNRTLMISVLIDGTAVRITQYINARDRKWLKEIDQVRARDSRDDPLNTHDLTNIFWHKLRFGELEYLDTGTVQTTLPAWANEFDKDVITVHLQLGRQGGKGRSKAINHGPDAHKSKSIQLDPIGPAGPIKTRTKFYADEHKHENAPVTFKFHYSSQDDGVASSFKPISTQVCEAGSFTPMVSSKLGKRSRNEYEEDMDESSIGLTTPISSKKAKQDPDGINPQYVRAKADGYI